MVRFTAGAVTGCGQSSRRGLQSRVVRNVEAPVDCQIRRPARLKVAIHQREQS